MRHVVLALCLATTGCVTSFDFVPVTQPELARAGRELVNADHARVHTVRGDEQVDANSLFKVDTPDGLHTGPWQLREAALDCGGKQDCKLTQPGEYTISKPHQSVDGDKVTSYVVATVLIAAVSGLVAEHVVCFSDPTCQNTARDALIVTDVAVGVTALATMMVAGFMYAVMRGLNN
jgi:hypothetical protein